MNKTTFIRAELKKFAAVLREFGVPFLAVIEEDDGNCCAKFDTYSLASFCRMCEKFILAIAKKHPNDRKKLVDWLHSLIFRIDKLGATGND